MECPRTQRRLDMERLELCHHSLIKGSLISHSQSELANACYRHARATHPGEVNTFCDTSTCGSNTWRVVQDCILSPVEMAQVEPLAPPPIQKLLAQATGQPRSILMGASLSCLVSSLQTVQLYELAAIT